MYFPKTFFYILHDFQSQGGYVILYYNLCLYNLCVARVFLHMAYDLLQIAPADLEAVLILHPEVVDVAVTR